MRRGTACVTGSASGIGRAVAARLTDTHDAVIGIDQAEHPDDVRFTALQGDVSDPGCAAALRDALQGLPPLRTAVHCAGISLDAPLLETSVAQMAHVLSVNVVGTHNITTAALSAMAGGGGVVVLISSQLARIPTPRRGAYTASKAAVERLVPDYAREAAAIGVRVVGLAPGPVVTGLTRERFTNPAEVDTLVARMAIDRLCEPGEIADVVEFLISDRSHLVNGTVVTADGGYLAYG